MQSRTRLSATAWLARRTELGRGATGDQRIEDLIDQLIAEKPQPRDIFEVHLLQSLEFSPTLDDILVVPLDGFCFRQPTLEVFDLHVVNAGVSRLGGFKAALGLQAGLIETLTAPEHQPHTVFHLAVTDNRIAIQEPYRMTMPDLAFRAGQIVVDLFGQQRTYLSVSFVLRIVISKYVRVSAGTLRARVFLLRI